MTDGQIKVLQALLNKDIEVTSLERNVDDFCYILEMKDKRRLRATISEHEIVYEMGPRVGEYTSRNLHSLESFDEAFPESNIKQTGVSTIFSRDTSFENRRIWHSMIQVLQVIPVECSFKAVQSGYCTSIEISGLEELSFTIDYVRNHNQEKVPVDSGSLTIGKEHYVGLRWELMERYERYVRTSLTKIYGEDYSPWDDILFSRV